MKYFIHRPVSQLQKDSRGDYYDSIQVQGKNFTRGEPNAQPTATEVGEEEGGNFDLFELDGDLNNRKLFSEATMDARSHISDAL